MKPFRNKGWLWFHYMEQILPVPTLDGSYAFAPSQSHELHVDAQEDDSEPNATSLQAPGPSNSRNFNSFGQTPTSFLTPPPAMCHPADITSSSQAWGLEMNVDSTGSTTIPFIMREPGHVDAGSSNFTMQQLASTGVSSKRQRTVSDNEESSYRSPTPPEALFTKSRQPTISSGKRSTKKRSSNTHPSANSASAPSASSAPSAPSAASAPASTSQRVAKMTPAVALVTLKTSVDSMTDAIITSANKPLETSQDRATGRRMQAVRLVQRRNDELNITQKASLISHFSSHPGDADTYLELEDEDLRRLIIAKWIGSES